MPHLPCRPRMPRRRLQPGALCSGLGRRLRRCGVRGMCPWPVRAVACDECVCGLPCRPPVREPIAGARRVPTRHRVVCQRNRVLAMPRWLRLPGAQCPARGVCQRHVLTVRPGLLRAVPSRRVLPAPGRGACHVCCGHVLARRPGVLPALLRWLLRQRHRCQRLLALPPRQQLRQPCRIAPRLPREHVRGPGRRVVLRVSPGHNVCRGLRDVRVVPCGLPVRRRHGSGAVHGGVLFPWWLFHVRRLCRGLHLLGFLRPMCGVPRRQRLLRPDAGPAALRVRLLRRVQRHHAGVRAMPGRVCVPVRCCHARWLCGWHLRTHRCDQLHAVPRRLHVRRSRDAACGVCARLHVVGRVRRAGVLRLPCWPQLLGPPGRPRALWQRYLRRGQRDGLHRVPCRLRLPAAQHSSRALLARLLGGRWV